MRFITKTTALSLLFSFHVAAFQAETTDDMKEASEHPVASSEFALMDKNKDGVVTEKEASEIGVNNLFSDMDMNDDGVLSRKEYTKYREQETPQTRDDF